MIEDPAPSDIEGGGESRPDVSHDVAIAGLAVLGAIACAIGLVTALGEPRPWPVGGLAIACAGLGAWIAASTVTDVTPVETAIAAVLTIPIGVGLDWTAPSFDVIGDRVPATIAATAAGVAAAWLGARLRVRSRWFLRTALALCILGAVVGGFLLGLIALFRVFGEFEITPLPWLAVALSSLLLAWLAPTVGMGEAFLGQWIGATAGFWVALPYSDLAKQPDTDHTYTVAFATMPIITALVCGAGTYAGHWVVDRMERRRAARGVKATARFR